MFAEVALLAVNLENIDEKLEIEDATRVWVCRRTFEMLGSCVQVGDSSDTLNVLAKDLGRIVGRFKY